MLRALWKRRGFAAVVIATLTLGLGATIGIFSVANAVLLRPLPYPNADRIVALRTLAEDGTPTARVAPRDMTALYDDHPSLSAAALAFYAEGRITGNDAVDYNLGRYGVTDQFFDVFSVPMALGRGFTRGEPQGPVVISYASWRDVFAADPDIIGKSIRVENGVRPVVGVTPEGFDFPGNAAYWTLMQLGPGYANLRGYLSYLKLKPDATIPQLEQQLAVLGNDLGPDAVTGRPVRFAVTPLLDEVVGDLRPTVLLLLGATGVLLAIACINVANLLLARGTARTRELAVRTALINVPFDAIQTFFPQPPAVEGGPPRFDASYRLIGDFFRELEARVRAIDGVESVSVSSSVPLSSQQWDPRVAFRIEGDAAPDASVSQMQAAGRSVSPSFFASMGIPVTAGRPFDANDRRESPGVAVVNETFVRRNFADGRALGRFLTLPAHIYRPDAVGFQYAELAPDRFEIVGVVADAKYLALGEPPAPSIYFSNEQFMLRRTHLIVRSEGDDPSALIAPIRAEIGALKPMPAEFELYSQVMRVSLARERLGMSLFAVFGAVALALAAVGVYGLMAYSVAQRTGEIAVRAALGASQRQIIAGVVARGAWLGLAGIALGVVVAAATGRVIASELYGVSTLDWGVFVAVPCALLAVALAAAYVPARRAARVDPAGVLQTE